MESLHLLYPKYVLKYFALSTIFIMSPVPSNQSIILTVDNNSTNNCFFFLFQGDFPSTALKTLISVSTLVLLGLIIAYHSLEVQVTKAVFIYYVIKKIHTVPNEQKSCAGLAYLLVALLCLW